MAHKQIVHYTSMNPTKCSNAAYFIGSHSIICPNKTPGKAYRSSIADDIPSYTRLCYTSYGPSLYKTSLLDCLNVVYKALKAGFFDFDDFDADECRHYEGYSYWEEGDKNAMRANCSCTLIKSKDNFNVIVDTMTPWDKDRIVEALSAKNIKPEDISVVVNTHGHSDHTGNNNLFVNAKLLIVGESISQRDRYLAYDFKNSYKLNDEIHVISTPGHTQTCVSVLVENSSLGGKVGICGDLFEKEEDISDCSIWLSAGSEDPEKQANNRCKIANMVDHILPGHGKCFKVTSEIRQKLEEYLKGS